MKKKMNIKKTVFKLFMLFAIFRGLGAAAQTQTFNASGTFTVPAGVTSLTVSAWGGGGAGGGVNGQTKAGGGGEGGSFVRGTITVVPGATYTVVVGNGGLGVNAANGGSGQPSSFSVSGGGATLFNAIGGVFGAVGSNFGAGGNATNAGNIVSGTSQSNFYGGNGGNATSSSSASSGGGGGSAGAGGAGGNGGSPLTAGTAGAGSGSPSDPGVVGATGRGSSNDGHGNDGGAPGAGGSGGRNANNSTVYRGGNGGTGRVSVIWTCPAPAISSHPSSQTICNGNPVTFTVVGSGASTYQWKKGASNISGATSSSYTIAAVSGSDAATYTVVLTNPCSSVTSNNAVLTVNTSPSISVHPVTQTKCAGQSVTFSVTASGTSQTYQWRKSGVNISGATSSSYTIPSVTATDAVTYDVIVSVVNCTSVTSNGASLAVNPLPSLFTVTGGGSYCVGGAGLVVGLSNSDNGINYQLELSGNAVGTPIAGNGSAISFGNQTAVGTYSVEAVNTITSCSQTMTASVVISTVPLPSSVSVTPSTSNMCTAAGAALIAVATTSSVAVHNDNFNGTPTYTGSGSTTGNRSQIFTKETSGTNVNSVGTFTSPNGGGIMISLAGASAVLGTSTSSANSQLTSAAINTNGFGSLTLTYNHTYKQGNSGSPSGKVEVSTDGSTWTTIKTFTTNQGGSTSFVADNIVLSNTYLNQANLQLRFNFVSSNSSVLSANSSWWAIDDVLLNGSPLALYSWTANTGAGVNGLPAGAETPSTANKNITVIPSANTIYTMTVTDPLTGCSNSSTATVNILPAPVPNASNNTPVCAGQNIMLFADGGFTNYSWTFSGGGFSSTGQNPVRPNSTGLMAGNYTVTVTDAFGCTGTETTNVAVNSNPVLSISSQTNVSCNGLSDGNIDLDASTGLAPYIFDLNGSSTVNGIYTSLTAGSYPASVIDDNGCSNDLTVVINQPAVLSFGTSVNNVSCPGLTDGSITVTASGGTIAYQYSNDNGNNYQSSSLFNALSPNNYNIMVKDANNCVTSSSSVTVGTTPDITAPVPDQASLTTASGYCSASVAAAPTATDNCAGVITGITFDPLSYNTPGTYTVHWNFDDGNGNFTTQNQSVVVNNPAAAITGTNSICVGNSTTLHLAFSGTAPFNYTVSDGTQTISGTASNSSEDVIVTPAAEGSYTYTVTSITDANCTGIATGSALVTVNPIPVVNMITSISVPADACNGTVMQLTANVSNSFVFNYKWNTGINLSVVKFSNNVNGPFVSGPFETSANTVYAQFGSLVGASGYNVGVEISNLCGTSGYFYKWIRGSMGTPGNISGSPIACSNQTGVNYSVVNISGAVYNWTFSVAGATFSGQGTNNVSVNFPVFTSGQLCVTAALSCGGSSTSAPRCFAISNATGLPSVISGLSKVCPGSTNVAYSVSPLSGAVSYNWTVPSGVTIVETPPYSNSIHVNFPASYTGAPPIYVYGVSACGVQSAGRNKSVGSLVPNTPGSITGPVAAICNSTVQYSIANVSGSTGYTWTIPAGATNLIGQGSTSIQFTAPSGFTSGYVTVQANTTACSPGTSALRSITVSGAPAIPSNITINPGGWCVGQTINASVNTVSPLPNYSWVINNGSIDAGQGTNNVDVITNNAHVIVTVRASNACGISNNRTLHTYSAGCRQEEEAVKSNVNGLSVSPNPAHSNITVSIDAKQNSDITLMLTDISGRTVISEKLTATAGLNKYQLDLNNLSKGIYLMQADFGGEVQKTKVVIE